MPEKEKEFVYLPKELAEKIKQIQDSKVIESIIIDYIDESKREIQANLENLDDDVIKYKGLMLKAKKAFEDAKNEQLTASYALWEKFEDERPNTTEKIESIVNLLNPLVNKLEEVNSLMAKVNLYDLEKFLKILSEISNLVGYNGQTAELLKFLFENFKK